MYKYAILCECLNLTCLCMICRNCKKTMADGEIVGDSSQSDDLSGESGDDDVDEERQLHNYFKFREYPYNIAVIFNDGERRPIRLTYGQVHDLARQVEQWVMEVMDGWCVGVCMDMNHLFPAVQIG